MSAPNHAMANRVADALLVNLKAIGVSTTTPGWLTKPKTVQRGLALDAVNLPKPGLFLRCMGWGPNTPTQLIGGVLTGRTDAKFEVLCLSDKNVTSREAEQELNDLARDVIDAVYLDYQLGTLLVSGYLTVTGYDPVVDLIKAGIAVAAVEITGTWLWDTNNP